MASRWVNRLVDAARSVLSGSGSTTTTRPARPARPSRQSPRATTRNAPRDAPARQRTAGAPGPTASGAYPGDFHGVVRAQYDPHPDGAPDPGEIVWTWVPYEEDHAQGKDRPVLLVGRDGAWLLALQLTSQDHDRDAAQEARAGRYWMDIGTGPWDRQGRPSEVRLNRVIRVAPEAVRREGAVMPRALFTQVADAMVTAMAKARR